MHRDFITRILGDMQGNAIMGVATGRTPKGKLEIRQSDIFKYPEELDKMVAYAEKKRHGDGRNVYLSPQIYGDQTNEHGKISRSKENALFSQTIYMDSDSCPPDAFRLEPSVHVNTSATHGHDYWVLTEPVSAAEAAEVAHRITTAHKDQGCDPTGWSPNKFLRMPTVNTSYDQENPFVIEVFDAGTVYDFLDIAGAYDNVVLEAPAAKRETLKVVQDLTEADLGDFMDLVSKIPQTETRLNDLIYKQPKDGPDGWRSEQRYALLLDLIRFGFTLQETVSVAWGSPAASKWREDDRGVAGLQAEAQRAWNEVQQERGGDDDGTPPPVSMVDVTVKSVKLLSDDERDWLEKHEHNFITAYSEYTKTLVPAWNAPYHTMNAFYILSVAFGAVGYLPKPARRVPCNIYGMQLGESSTGKSEATEIFWQFVSHLNPHDSPDIGGTHSETNLLTKLLERKDKVSVFWSDEADGLLRTWAQGGWTAGVQEVLTKVYDGPIPQLGLKSASDLAVAGAEAVVIQHLMGTLRGMMDNLTESMFERGFLARQIWTIGHDMPTTKESLKTKQVFGDATRHYESTPKYWANVFNRAIVDLRADLPIGRGRVPMNMTDEAVDRMDQAKLKMDRHFAKLPNQHIYRTSIRRMYDIIWKTAALLAMSQGKSFIDSTHVVTILKYTEGWLENLVYVVQNISSSEFSKAQDKIELFLRSRPDHAAEASMLFNQFRHIRTNYFLEYLDAMKRQRRIIEIAPKNAGGPTQYKLREAAIVND